jgi:thioredoxin reductase
MYRLIEADHYVNDQILVVGGGDSAVEAAMGLAIQHGNNVTLSYPPAAAEPRASSAGRAFVRTAPAPD